MKTLLEPVNILNDSLTESNEAAGQIAANNWHKTEVFKKNHPRFYLGGTKTVKEAYAARGINVTEVEQELQPVEQNSSTTRPLPYDDWELDFLADYIRNKHHSYVKKILPDLRSYAIKVSNAHGSEHQELAAIRYLAEEICDELSTHMIKEETVLFPYIKQLVTSKNTGKPVHHGLFNTVKTPIKTMVDQHEEVGKSVREIRALSNNYLLPEDACESYAYLFKTLEEFENDLHIHVHLENDILFPKALGLEKR